MCFWMPAAVLSTFPQLFQRHLNITFMEFWKGGESDIKTDTNRPIRTVFLPSQRIFPLFLYKTRQC